MEYCKLGNMQSSRIVMGCMRIADKPLEEVEKVIVEALGLGVNTFDLADIYGGGGSERVLGAALRDLNVPREKVLLQTKCGIHKSENGRCFDFSKEYILQSVDGSLKRLNTDYVDALLLHRPDTLMELDEVAEAFEKLKKQGKVKTFGVSNFSAMQMKLFKSYGIEVAANQIQCSLMHTPMIDAGFNVNMYNDESISRAGDILEYCRMEDIRLQAWSPMQYGFFKGTFIGNEEFPLLNAKLLEIAKKYDSTPTGIATAWLLRHPVKMQVITGTTSPIRMREMCLGEKVKLTREEWYSLYMATGKTLP